MGFSTVQCRPARPILPARGPKASVWVVHFRAHVTHRPAAGTHAPPSHPLSVWKRERERGARPLCCCFPGDVLTCMMPQYTSRPRGGGTTLLYTTRGRSYCSCCYQYLFGRALSERSCVQCVFCWHGKTNQYLFRTLGGETCPSRKHSLSTCGGKFPASTAEPLSGKYTEGRE